MRTDVLTSRRWSDFTCWVARINLTGGVSLTAPPRPRPWGWPGTEGRAVSSRFEAGCAGLSGTSAVAGPGPGCRDPGSGDPCVLARQLPADDKRLARSSEPAVIWQVPKCSAVTRITWPRLLEVWGHAEPVAHCPVRNGQDGAFTGQVARRSPGECDPFGALRHPRRGRAANEDRSAFRRAGLRVKTPDHTDSGLARRCRPVAIPHAFHLGETQTPGDSTAGGICLIMVDLDSVDLPRPR